MPSGDQGLRGAVAPELQQVEGYHAYFSSAEKKGYSGVALYTRTEPQRLIRGFGSERFDGEGRIIIADYGPFVLFDIYFPNGQMSSERLAYKMEFYDAFLDYAKGSGSRASTSSSAET